MTSDARSFRTVGAGRVGGRRARPVAEVLEGRQLLAVITVNSTGDADGADGSDTLSLRQAIEVANQTLKVSTLTPAQQALVSGAVASPGSSTIDFDIPGTGPFTISPTTTLPTILGAVTIDGYSQPGSSPNTNGPGLGDNAVIEIELNGSRLQIGSTAPYGYGSGLIISGFSTATSLIEGLAIDGFNGVVPAVPSFTFAPGTPAMIVGGGIVLQGGNDNVEGCFIGVGASGEVSDGNAGAGVIAYTAAGTIGGTTPAARNVISNNGVNVANGLGGSYVVQGNFIGTDASGTKALSTPNATFGQGVASNFTIGGTVAGAGNLISGNRIGIQGSGTVEGNLIGTDVTGTKAIGNTADGIVTGMLPTTIGNLPPDGGGNDSMTIGGTAAGAGNVISGNSIGVDVENFISANVLPLPNPGESDDVNQPTGQFQSVLIQGNKVGTDITGTAAVGNVVGIHIANFGLATVGGTAAGAGNVISGNARNGIEDDQSTSGNLIEGDLIGTDATGTKALGNGGDGIFLAGVSDTVGGTVAGAGNVISGNGSAGLAITPQPSSFNDNFQSPPFYVRVLPLSGRDLVEGNAIGTDISRALPLGNAASGILIAGSNNSIGASLPGTGNLIADNKGAGVAVVNYLDPSAVPPSITAGSGLQNRITSNSIYGNGGLGIDLGLDGVTPNNPAESPTGPNHLVPYPVLNGLSPAATGSVLSGSYNALPFTQYTLEFFSNPVAGHSGPFQGQTYLGSVPVTTDAAGSASFVFAVTASTSGSTFITTTATDSLGDTSEFSQAFSPLTPVLPPLIPSVAVTGSTTIASQGQPITFTAVVGATLAGPSTGLVGFVVDGLAIGFAPIDASGVATFVTDQLTPGPHAITAAYLGDSTHAPSLSAAFAESIQPVRAFGGPGVSSAVFAGANSVTVSFNRALLLGPAQDPLNYSIVGPGSRKITVTSATYDPSTESVTLTTRQELDPKQAYKLTINGVRSGRVVDIYGIPLNGKSAGHPGSNFAGKIATRPVIVAKAHPTAKVAATASKKGR